MTAIETAYAFYKERGENFAEILAWYSHYGYVISMPDCLVLARPIKRENPESLHALEQSDAWFVHFACGKGAIKRMIGFAPQQLPYIVFTRLKGAQSAFKTISTEKLLSLS